MPNNENNVFINESFNEGFRLYLENKDKKDSLDYNRFLCCVIRMLVLIYGEEDLVLAYNSKDAVKFDTVLTSYGFNNILLENFKLVLDKFYKFDLKQQVKAIKKKNKFFNLVQKYLIDMMICKNAKIDVDSVVRQEFYDMLFTANSKDFYRKSTAVLLAYNPYEIDDYAKKQNIV